MEPSSGLLAPLFQGLALIESCLPGVVLFSFFLLLSSPSTPPFRKTSQNKLMHFISCPLPSSLTPFGKARAVKKVSKLEIHPQTY